MAKKFKNLIPLIIWCQFNHLIIPYLNFWPMYKTTASEIGKKSLLLLQSNHNYPNELEQEKCPEKIIKLGCL